MNIVPLLLKPKLYGIKNSFHQSCKSTKKLCQDSLFFILCIMFVCLLYFSIKTGFEHGTIREIQKYLYLPIARIFALITLPLFIMQLVSNIVIALGIFYLALDLDLLLSSPISAARFFFGKTASLFLMTFWMPMLILVPLVAAFGQIFSTPFSYYFISIGLLIFFLIIPTSIAVIFSTGLAFVISTKYNRLIVTISLIILLTAAYLFISTISDNGYKLNELTELIRLFSFFSAADLNWLPSTWFANIMQQLLYPSGLNIIPEVGLLISMAVATTSLAFLTIKHFHNKALIKVNNTHKVTVTQSLLLDKSVNFITKLPSTRAFTQKEAKYIVRDVAHLIQLLFVILVSIIYLYNLSIFSSMKKLPFGTPDQWRLMFIIGNFCMGAFLLTAITTRFVFPSISLEGRNFWIVLSSPLGIKNFLLAKFKFWVSLMSLITVCFFLIGAITIHSNMTLIFAYVILAFATSCSVTSWGLSMGAVFSKFDWEHPSEIIATFGSMCFMLIGILTIFINIIMTILSALLLTKVFGIALEEAILFITVPLVVFNAAISKFALKLGENSLKRKMAN